MAAYVQPGEGATLSVGSTPAVVAGIVEIDGPAINVEAIDATVLAGPLILTRPSRFPEPDKLTLKIFFDPGDTVGQKLFITDVQLPGVAGALPLLGSETWAIQFNDQHTTHGSCGFTGFVTKFGLNGMKKGSNLGADVEIQLTSLLTFTAGSS
jgi:hypothetical protein